MPLKSFDYSILNRTWKQTLPTGMREWDGCDDFEEEFEDVESRYIVFYAHIYSNPARKERRDLIRFLSKYLCRHQISLKLLLCYNPRDNEVVYSYCSHSSGKNEVEGVGVNKFIGRMVQQILLPRFKRIRYYDPQFPSNRNRLTARMYEAIGCLSLLTEVEMRSKVSARLSYTSFKEIGWGSTYTA